MQAFEVVGKRDVTGNSYITDPSQKLPAASDNVQNHSQVTKVVELASPLLRYTCIFRNLLRVRALIAR